MGREVEKEEEAKKNRSTVAGITVKAISKNKNRKPKAVTPVLETDEVLEADTAEDRSGDEKENVSPREEIAESLCDVINHILFNLCHDGASKVFDSLRISFSTYSVKVQLWQKRTNAQQQTAKGRAIPVQLYPARAYSFIVQTQPDKCTTLLLPQDTRTILDSDILELLKQAGNYLSISMDSLGQARVFTALQKLFGESAFQDSIVCLLGSGRQHAAGNNVVYDDNGSIQSATIEVTAKNFAYPVKPKQILSAI